MKFTINLSYPVGTEDASNEYIHVDQLNTIGSLLRPFSVTRSPGLIHTLKLHHVISTCFVLNKPGYGGHNITVNYPFMNFILVSRKKIAE